MNTVTYAQTHFAMCIRGFIKTCLITTYEYNLRFPTKSKVG